MRICLIIGEFREEMWGEMWEGEFRDGKKERSGCHKVVFHILCTALGHLEQIIQDPIFC